MYVLYHFPYSQHARRVVSLLIEAGIEYELRCVNMAEDEHLQEHYLEVNPNHQVPMLVDVDLVISESNAILRYLCNKHALTHWYPQEAKSRAAVDQWLDWNQCRLGPVVVDIVLNSVFLGDRGDRAAVERARQKLPDSLRSSSVPCARANFVPHSQPSIADLSIASNIFQLGLADIHLPSGRLRAWCERVAQLKGFARSNEPLNAA